MSCKSVLVIVALICFAFTVGEAYARLMVPFEIDYEEGNILNAAVRVVHGETPYPDPRSFPYILNPYGPVGYLLTALGVGTFGLSLFGPRFLVFLGGLGICVMLTVLTRRLGGRSTLGFVLGTAYLSGPLVAAWFPLLRVDFWAILLSLLGLYAFALWPRRWYIATIFFAIALLTKHTALAGPLACAVYLITEGKLKRMLWFTLAIAATLLACSLCLGKHFVFQMLHTHPDPYSAQQLLNLYAGAIQGLLLPLAVIIYSVACGFRWAGESRLAWLYLAACSVTAVTAGKLGSNSNHFLEWSGAVCLVAGLGLSNLTERQTSLARFFTFGLILTVAVFGMRRLLASEKDDQSGCAEAYAWINSSPSSRILSEDVASLVLSGKPVLVSNPFVTTQLGNSVQWSKGSIEQLVREQYFDWIVLGGDVRSIRLDSGRWSPLFIKMVAEKYRPDRRFRCDPCLGVAYVPKRQVAKDTLDNLLVGIKPDRTHTGLDSRAEPGGVCRMLR